MDIEVSGVEAINEALLNLVNLAHLIIIFESEENVDNDTDDEYVLKDSAEKKAYLKFFNRIEKLKNLRKLTLRNTYLPSEDRIRRNIMRKLPGLVKLK
jgi:hypothetical protein